MNNTICLNMIVKNESKIIERLLRSVLPIIDTYCICDTGSTDNTIEIIKDFWIKNKIDGKIIEEPFQNFSYNRNHSLKACKGMSDYILLLDADMILNINNFNKNEIIDSDVVQFLQGSKDFYYKNIRIIKNNKDYEYIGLTHEYLNTNNVKNTLSLSKEQIFINDIGDGGCKRNKFKRDIELLIKGIEDEPDNERYYFYLANSYRDYGENENAIKYYEKRINLKGWKEEVWCSYYEIGNCYKKMDKMNEAMSYWLDAHNYYPERLEAIYEIMKHQRCKGNYILCNLFYNSIKANLESNINRDDYLFLHKDIYTYKIFYEYTIFAFYNKILKIDNEIVNVLNNTLHDSIRNRLLSNIQFYDLKLRQKEVITLTNNKVIDINDENIKFYSSSSCLIKNINKDGYLMNIRYVNYYVADDGSYINYKENIISLNEYVELDNNFNILNRNIFTLGNEKQFYEGIEDIRIYNHNNNILFNGVKPYKINDKIFIEMVTGKYDIKLDKLNLEYMKTTFNNERFEKNWVYTNYDNELCVIYKWFPLTICSIKDNEISIKKEVKMPWIFNEIRGSSNSYEYFNSETKKKELWFIVHNISNKTPRNYYHLLVVFDEKFNLIKYTSLFTFENEKIEFSLSIIVNDNEIIINYSNWDRTTKIGLYDKNYIETLFIQNF